MKRPRDLAGRELARALEKAFGCKVIPFRSARLQDASECTGDRPPSRPDIRTYRFSQTSSRD